MKYIENLLRNYPELSENNNGMTQSVELICKAFSDGKKLLLCGNGGSAADCEHISGELLKGFLLKRELSAADKAQISDCAVADKLQYGLPCIPLTSLSSLMTAVANDNDAAMIFAQSVYALGTAGDVLLALSTSGNSENIINAVFAAKAKKMKIISITGEKNSKLSELSDITLKMPSSETYRIQEYTLPVYHAICAEIENCFYA